MAADGWNVHNLPRYYADSRPPIHASFLGVPSSGAAAPETAAPQQARIEQSLLEGTGHAEAIKVCCGTSLLGNRAKDFAAQTVRVGVVVDRVLPPISVAGQAMFSDVSSPESEMVLEVPTAELKGDAFGQWLRAGALRRRRSRRQRSGADRSASSWLLGQQDARCNSWQCQSFSRSFDGFSLVGDANCAQASSVARSESSAHLSLLGSR